MIVPPIFNYGATKHQAPSGMCPFENKCIIKDIKGILVVIDQRAYSN